MDANLTIEKNYRRLLSEPYTIDRIYQPGGYDWAGDYEGRALLAFVCHYKISGRKIPCMEKMIRIFPEKVNEQGFLGAPFNGIIDEQQLSGHSWLLRGLVAYAETFRDQTVADYAKKIVHSLFLPSLKEYDTYPVDRSSVQKGGVYGNVAGTIGQWRLSTDVGCAFIPLDGLAHYYAFTGDETLKKPLEKVIEQFMKLDKLALQVQTHATLTAARGILKFYEVTGEKKYLEYARDLFILYTEHGMTLTYENCNWFGREDSWTEPCAVVDSLILAIRLYEISGDGQWKTLARRIWFNGLQFCQKENGGVGPNSIVTSSRPLLYVEMYEATACCSMRYAEGLLFYTEHSSLFAEDEAKEIVREGNRYFSGDYLLAEDLTDTFPAEKKYFADGHTLLKIPSLNEIPEAKALETRLKVVF